MPDPDVPNCLITIVRPVSRAVGATVCKPVRQPLEQIR